MTEYQHSTSLAGSSFLIVFASAFHARLLAKEGLSTTRYVDNVTECQHKKRRRLDLKSTGYHLKHEDFLRLPQW